MPASFGEQAPVPVKRGDAGVQGVRVCYCVLRVCVSCILLGLISLAAPDWGWEDISVFPPETAMTPQKFQSAAIFYP